MGSDELVKFLASYICCTLYSQLTEVYLDMDILTLYCMLFPILAASSLPDNF